MHRAGGMKYMYVITWKLSVRADGTLKPTLRLWELETKVDLGAPLRARKFVVRVGRMASVVGGSDRRGCKIRR